MSQAVEMEIVEKQDDAREASNGIRARVEKRPAPILQDLEDEKMLPPRWI
jgi:hypothetical protein